MKHSILAGSAAISVCLGFSASLFAAEPAATGAVKPDGVETKASATQPAEKCMSDLRAFDSQMGKEGYWLSGYHYGYGYPTMGYGGYSGAREGGDTAGVTGYQSLRPGYDVRTLIAASTILARAGNQQQCEDVLSAARDSYKSYVAEMQGKKAPVADMPDWEQRQITAAQPVTAQSAAFRSDELIGMEVRNQQNEALGSVDDIIMSPQNGKIGFLVIGRGGIFGIDEKYVPVPWEDFKTAPGANLLVLDASKSAMEAAPQVNHDQFTTAGHFDQRSAEIGAYWKTHLSNTGTNKTNG